MARRLARSRLVSHEDADDVVAEVFASVFGAFEQGRGPLDSFAPYLVACVRNECHRANRRRLREPAAAMTTDEGAPSATRDMPDPYAAVDEASLLREAFESLPPRFRAVLWHTEVAGESYAAVGARDQLTRHAVSMLALRARRALATAYLARHLAAEASDTEINPACHAIRGELVHLVRGAARPRQRLRIERHLRSCDECADLRTRLDRLNRHLHASPLWPGVGLANLAIGSMSIDGAIKAQLATWWSMTAHVAMSSLVMVSVLDPVVIDADPLTDAARPAAPAAVEVPASPTHDVATAAGVDPTGPVHRTDESKHDRPLPLRPEPAPSASAQGSPDALDAAAIEAPATAPIDATQPVPLPGQNTVATAPAEQIVPPAFVGEPASDTEDVMPGPGAAAANERASGPPAPGATGRPADDDSDADRGPTPGPSGNGPPPHAGGPPASLPARPPSPPGAGNRHGASAGPPTTRGYPDPGQGAPSAPPAKGAPIPPEAAPIDGEHPSGPPTN